MTTCSLKELTQEQHTKHSPTTDQATSSILAICHTSFHNQRAHQPRVL